MSVRPLRYPRVVNFSSEFVYWKISVIILTQIDYIIMTLAIKPTDRIKTLRFQRANTCRVPF
jgi:hypothetical protein